MSSHLTFGEFLSDQRVINSYPTVTERYYEAKFFRDQTRPDSDQTVLLHSNRVCLVTLSPNHQIIKSKKCIKNIDFNVDDGVNRLDNKVTGKWKKGGQKVNPNSVLCRITCNDDQVFDVKACINGTIVEINSKLLENFDLLTQKTWSDGYIAVILPFLGRHASEKESLISCDEYKSLLQNESQSSL